MIRGYYLLIAAVAGAAVLALEVLAARAMAPALGSGSVSWSALLAVALGMLAVGNLVGGLLSDRVETGGLIAWSLITASACLVLLSQVYPAAMEWAAVQSLVLGAVTAAAITQAVPLVMLGAITPGILRLGHDSGPKGWWAGLVLAAGSSGGIVGALLAGIVLLPRVGLARSYLLTAALLAVAALPPAWLKRRWAALLLTAALLAVVGFCWFRYQPEGVIQSVHGQLEVQDTETGHVLLIDGLPQTGLPGGTLRPGDGLRYGYLLEAALMMRPQARDALVIGLGAGLAPRLLAAHGLDCQAVEVDPIVAEIAAGQFGFAGPVTLSDGRAFLAHSSRCWDLIFLDVCTADRLPSHLFTVEALRIVHRRLSPDGVLVIQWIGDDGPWSASLERTVRGVFGGCLMLTASSPFGGVGPRWLFAARGYPAYLPTEPSAAEDRLPWRPVRLEVEGWLLSDDHFPAELHWARTARQWRSLYAAGPRSASR